jgi:hypothetical protein
MRIEERVINSGINQSTVAGAISCDERRWRFKKTEHVLETVVCPLSHRVHTAVLCGFGRFIMLWFWQEMLYEAARTVEKAEGAHKL